MLPIAFASDFTEPKWVEVPLNGDGNPPARMLLKPLTLDDYLVLCAKHGVCSTCWGVGAVDGEPCKVCGGKQRIPEMIPEFRLDLLRLVVHGWEGLLAVDERGEVVEVPFSEQARDGLARMVREAWEPIRQAAQALGEARVAAKKGSVTTPSGSTSAARKQRNR